MAIYKLISLAAEITDQGLRRTVVRKVQGYTDEYLLLADVNLPRKGVADLPNHPNSICVAVNVNYIENSINVWEHSAVFMDTAFIPPGGQPPTFYAVPNVQSSLEPVRIWRSGAVLPDDASAPDPTLDILGVGQDLGGEPVDEVISVERLTIRQRLTSINWAFFDSYKETRNSQTYYGRAAGTVLYVGYSHGDPDGDGYITVTHDFAVDSYFHLRQIAGTSSEGKVITKSAGVPLPNGLTLKTGQAYYVYWRQPFPLTSNFMGVFS